MPEISFPVEMAGGVPVVTAPEEIDITNAGGLRSALLQAATPGNRTLVVDMSRTQFATRPRLTSWCARTNAPKPTAVNCC
jgi:hypothetical protein